MHKKTLPIFCVITLAVLGPGILIQAPHPAQAAPSAPTATESWSSLVISNEAPGYLVDHLIALGHGGETLFQVLGYLKSQSNGVISDSFYNQVASANPASLVFSDHLSLFAGLVGGIEIAGDGSLAIPNLEGRDYAGKTCYPSQFSLDNQFELTYAQDAACYIYTHTDDYGGGVLREYYAFAIAWKYEPVETFSLSNEPPGRLVDKLINQGYGNLTLLQVLNYLKSQSNGAISDAFYNQVASATPGSEVFTATLGNYLGLDGGIEICGDGTLYINSQSAINYLGAPGYTTTPSLDGSFHFTLSQDLPHNIYTHGFRSGPGAGKDFYLTGFAWSDGIHFFLPLVQK